MTRPAVRPTRSGALPHSFDPPGRSGALVAAAAAGIALLLGLALLTRGILEGISFAGFLSFCVALVLLGAGAVAGYWAWACATLRYELAAGLLVIRWGLVRHEIPLALFERIVRARAGTVPPAEGLDWPGCHVGRTSVPRLGTVEFISLHRAETEVLYLLGPGARYAISVADPKGFTRALQAQFDLPTVLSAPRVEAHPLVRLLGRGDARVQQTLGVSLALALLVTGIVFSRYAGFPDQIVVSFPGPARIAARSVLLGIPLAAWGMLATNGVAGMMLAQRSRTAAFTLIGGGAFVEAMLVVAAFAAA